MRAAIILSLIAHIAVLQWVLNGLPSSQPIELSSIEALPVDLVPIGEITDIAKGSEAGEELELREVAPPWPTETPSPVAPEPTPTPPPPEEAMAPPEPEPAHVAEPEPIPPLEMAEPEPEPVEQAQAEPPPDPEPAAEPPPPPPEPEPATEPPPPPPEPEPAPPPVEKVETPTPDPAPVPKSRPKPPRLLAQADAAPSDLSDKIQALLDQQRPSQSQETASVGSRTGRDGAIMTQTELNALAAKMRGCWSPPLGATGADELRTVVLIRLNRDGSLSGSPEIVSRPPGRYATTAPESVVRAIGRCAPYDLPGDKYSEWREIEFDFYPVDMF